MVVLKGQLMLDRLFPRQKEAYQSFALLTAGTL